MTNATSTFMSVPSLYYSYQQNFQKAVHNLEAVIQEERLHKRIRKVKERQQKPR
jgi:hypothetical protein